MAEHDLVVGQVEKLPQMAEHELVVDQINAIDDAIRALTNMFNESAIETARRDSIAALQATADALPFNEVQRIAGQVESLGSGMQGLPGRIEEALRLESTVQSLLDRLRYSISDGVREIGQAVPVEGQATRRPLDTLPSRADVQGWLSALNSSLDRAVAGLPDRANIHTSFSALQDAAARTSGEITARVSAIDSNVRSVHGLAMRIREDIRSQTAALATAEALRNMDGVVGQNNEVLREMIPFLNTLQDTMPSTDDLNALRAAVDSRMDALATSGHIFRDASDRLVSQLADAENAVGDALGQVLGRLDVAANVPDRLAAAIKSSELEMVAAMRDVTTQLQDARSERLAAQQWERDLQQWAEELEAQEETARVEYQALEHERDAALAKAESLAAALDAQVESSRQAQRIFELESHANVADKQARIDELEAKAELDIVAKENFRLKTNAATATQRRRISELQSRLDGQSSHDSRLQARNDKLTARLESLNSEQAQIQEVAARQREKVALLEAHVRFTDERHKVIETRYNRRIDVLQEKLQSSQEMRDRLEADVKVGTATADSLQEALGCTRTRLEKLTEKALRLQLERNEARNLLDQKSQEQESANLAGRQTIALDAVKSEVQALRLALGSSRDPHEQPQASAIRE